MTVLLATATTQQQQQQHGHSCLEKYKASQSITQQKREHENKNGFREFIVIAFISNLDRFFFFSNGFAANMLILQI